MLQYCFCFKLCFFGQRCIWDLSSPTRNWTHTPCTGRRGLDKWTAREVLPSWRFWSARRENPDVFVITSVMTISERKCNRSCVLVRSAVITKYHRLGGLNNRNLFSHSLEARSLRSGCQRGWVTVSDFFLACGRSPLIQCSSGSSIAVCLKKEISLSSFCDKATNSIRLAPHP